MLEFLDSPYNDEDGDLDVEQTEDTIGDDLQGDYMADLKPIHYIDPGFAILVIQLKANDIIDKAEAREYLGLDEPVEA